MWRPRLENVESKIAFGQLILRKIIIICCHQMSDFKAKMHQNPNSAGAPPHTPLRELTALPQTP